jgi:tetrahydromethanopterin S-methyltransferase subunit G
MTPRERDIWRLGFLWGIVTGAALVLIVVLLSKAVSA